MEYAYIGFGEAKISLDNVPVKSRFRFAGAQHWAGFGRE
jgi:hypothetical protein